MAPTNVFELVLWIIIASSVRYRRRPSSSAPSSTAKSPPSQQWQPLVDLQTLKNPVVVVHFAIASLPPSSSLFSYPSHFLMDSIGRCSPSFFARCFASFAISFVFAQVPEVF